MRKIRQPLAALQWQEDDSYDVLSTNGESSTTSNVTMQDQLAQLTNIVYGMATKNNGSSTSGSGTIPCYDPSDKTADINKWLMKVDDLKQMHDWSDVTTTDFAMGKLRGYAQRWYAGLSTVKYSWEEWKEKLRSAFPEKVDFHSTLDVMMKRVQLSGESVVEYYYDKLGLLEACDLFKEKAVSCIIAGLRDSHVRITAKVGSFDTPEKL